MHNVNITLTDLGYGVLEQYKKERNKRNLSEAANDFFLEFGGKIKHE